MGRVNKSTEGVFVNIVGSNSEISKYKQFLHRSPSTMLSGKYQGSEVEKISKYQGLLAAYSNKCSVIKMDLEQLAQLEVILMQIRSREDIEGNIVWFTMRNKYVYARCPFFRTDQSINEMRCLIDNLEFHFKDPKDTDLTMLAGNPEFVEKTKEKLTSKMDEEINENIRNYEKVYGKIS
jgi:hypothetical protein